ncbi:MAG TPA: hypothetical protein VE084_12810, partial [Burkholderiaceae bacterium]|nr:hypothetical protein [Burkholderiaceae bacterium]
WIGGGHGGICRASNVAARCERTMPAKGVWMTIRDTALRPVIVCHDFARWPAVARRVLATIAPCPSRSPAS